MGAAICERARKNYVGRERRERDEFEILHMTTRRKHRCKRQIALSGYHFGATVCICTYTGYVRFSFLPSFDMETVNRGKTMITTTIFLSVQ